MKISVIGSGYVGLVTGTCFADFGNEVTVVDNDRKKINSLRKGKAPFYEPGLDALIHKNFAEKRLSFLANLKAAINSTDIIFVCVGTPSCHDGSVDITAIKKVATEIGRTVGSNKTVALKSTVPVGTSEIVANIIKEELTKRKKSYMVNVVSNPEFLREGSAVFDATHPNRIIVGTDSDFVRKLMADVYRPLYLLGVPIVFTNQRTAELAKYAANAFLAMKISYINEMANLCEAVGADITDIAKALGYDQRIGAKFLHSGVGYGGSCFPKDTRGLVCQAEQAGCKLHIIPAVVKVNDEQVERFCDKVKTAVKHIKGKTIGILGLSFKPNTDDVREAPALKIIQLLKEAKAVIQVYDPVAMAQAKRCVTGVKYCRDAYQTAYGADALLIVTEWNEFRNLDFKKIKKIMKQPVVFDGRNIYNPNEMKNLGFTYYGVGRGKV